MLWYAAWRLMGAEMYSGMSSLAEASPVVARGCSLHRLVRALTAALGGDAWLGFMGNEFGHPEWCVIPRLPSRPIPPPPTTRAMEGARPG